MKTMNNQSWIESWRVKWGQSGSTGVNGGQIKLINFEKLEQNFWNSGKDEFQVPELFWSDNFTQKELDPDPTLT